MYFHYSVQGFGSWLLTSSLVGLKRRMGLLKGGHVYFRAAFLLPKLSKISSEPKNPGQNLPASIRNKLL
jgi:hypothetical protein